MPVPVDSAKRVTSVLSPLSQRPQISSQLPRISVPPAGFQFCWLYLVPTMLKNSVAPVLSLKEIFASTLLSLVTRRR